MSEKCETCGAPVRKFGTYDNAVVKRLTNLLYRVYKMSTPIPDKPSCYLPKDMVNEIRDAMQARLAE
jgi:hypothetical protein